MKKKMIYLFLIIVCLGSLFLITGWHKHQKENRHPNIHKILTAQAQIAPQTMPQFLRGNF